jgi:hypothetical protein
MGKRGGKSRRNKPSNNPKPEATDKVPKQEDWRSHKLVHENSYFRRFYEIQLEPYFKDNPSEFSVFWEAMKIKLPVVFRINPNQPNYLNFKNKLDS